MLVVLIYLANQLFYQLNQTMIQTTIQIIMCKVIPIYQMILHNFQTLKQKTNDHLCNSTTYKDNSKKGTID